MSYNRPSFIHIDIVCTEEHVTGTIVNSRHSESRNKAAGIGLENVRKRLELIYGPRNYTLRIDEQPETYTVQLVIPILHA